MLTIMNTKKYILFALAVLALTASCMKGSWDAPSPEEGMAAYGNQSIKPTNVKTIAEVKALYANEINNSSLAQVTKPMQIMGLVTGNDVGGNIYNTLYIQDNTGAIAISVGQGGLYGAFSVGQTVLIELNGLYVGGYGKQAQIGTTYTNPNKEGATPQVGRMTRYVWAEHYKLVPPVAGLTVAPLEVKFNLNSLEIAEDCAKLITLKGVELAEADGKAVFAPSKGVTLTANCANRTIKGVGNVVLRTSTYADFANYPMPTGRVDITGVATRYNDTWQFLMRSINDIQATSLAPDDVPGAEETIGSLAAPLSVSDALERINKLADNTKEKLNAYVKGKVVKVTTNQTNFDKYGNLNYYISVDGQDNNTIQVYSGDGLNGEKFKTINDIKAGDEVIVLGKLYKYVNNSGTVIPEIDKGNYLVSLNGKTK